MAGRIKRKNARKYVKSHPLYHKSSFELVFLRPSMGTCDGQHNFSSLNLVSQSDEIPDLGKLPREISEVKVECLLSCIGT